MTHDEQNKRMPRGVLPTFVSDGHVILCKNSRTVRNSYEIRLMLYMAIKSGRVFVLAVLPGARVAPDLSSHLAAHGALVKETSIETYSVYIGHQRADGTEGDGWVFGNSDSWARFLATLTSRWLKSNLAPGVTFAGDRLFRLREEFEVESVPQVNLDNENIKTALLALADEALAQDGELFIQ